MSFRCRNRQNCAIAFCRILSYNGGDSFSFLRAYARGFSWVGRGVGGAASRPMETDVELFGPEFWMAVGAISVVLVFLYVAMRLAVYGGLRDYYGEPKQKPKIK